MLDEKDLQAIQKMIDASEERTRRYMNVLIESDVTPKFNLLADGIKDIQERSSCRAPAWTIWRTR